MATTSDMAPTRRKSGGTSQGREKELEAQISQLQADLKAVTDTLGKLTGEKVGEARQIASSEFKHLQRQGQKMLDDAQEQVGEVEQQIKDTIREKPLTAVAAAVGAGFLLALLTRR
ncbi:YqjD family protein [Devosia honganensis]|uniref:YqjD family protein n=1 Tax=Devosia honganensis TaxID=1610527 RepID=A0ABV7WW27_9HYPH